MQPPEDLPIWVRREKERELQATAKQDLPWPLYLLFSVMVSIASVRSECHSPVRTIPLGQSCKSVRQAANDQR
jgi:hypothetical protein